MNQEIPVALFLFFCFFFFGDKNDTVCSTKTNICMTADCIMGLGNFHW